MYVSRKLTFILALCLSLFLSSGIFASTTKLGYSGRLVLTNGTPVTGTPDLKFDLFYSGSTGVNRGTQTINAVPLSNGIYTVELDFAGIASVINAIPTNETLVIQVTDITDTMNPVVYDSQNILATPIAVYANHAALAETIANDAVTPDSVDFTGSCASGQVVSVNASNEFECVNQTPAVSVDSTLVNNAGVIGLPTVVTGDTYYSVTVDDYGRVTGGSTTPPSTTANDIQDNLIVDADINTSAAISWSKINKTGATPSDVGLTVNSAGPLGTTSAVATENVVKSYVDTTATTIADAKVINDMSGVQTTIAPSVDSVKNYVTAQTSAITSSQWTDSGLDIYFNTGNVGIGTSSPAHSLHINGTTAVSGIIRDVNVGLNKLQLNYDTAPNSNSISLQSRESMYFISDISPLGSGPHHFVFASGNANVNSAVELVRIESTTGNVGIGTSTPSEKLEVSGNAKATGFCIGADCITSWPTGNAGTVTSVTGGTGLTGGTITSSGTLAVDVGTTNGKIAQVGAGDKLADSIINYNPALDVALTGYTTGAASSVSATDTVLQAFGKIQGQLDAHATSIAAAVTSVTGGTGLTGGTITSSGTLAVDVGTTNGKIAQVGAGDKLADSIINYNPAIDVALTGFSVGADSSVSATDTVLEAFGKVQAQLNSQATSIAANSTQWTTSASDIYYSTGMVGIGTTSPRTKLHLSDAMTNNANVDESGFYSQTLHAIDTNGSYSSRAAYVVNATQIDSGVTSAGMQVGQLTQALRNSGANGDNGTLAVQTASNVAYGHYSYDGTASPITTDAYGIKVTNYNRSGSVTNAYDLHIGNDSGAGGTVTNRFGLYQVGASYKNYFQGSVGIGTNSPTTELEVSGIVSANNIGLSLPASNSLDSNALPAGLYRSNTSTTGSPTPGESGATLNMQSGVASGAVAQLHIKANNTEDPRAFIRHSDNTGDFKDWQEIVTADATGNVGIGTTATQKLTVDGNINVTATNDICIDGTGCLAAAISGAGEVNAASSAGGTSLYKTKTGTDLVFKGLTSSSDITLTANTNDVGLAINTVNGASELLRLDGSGRVPASNVMGTPLTGYAVGTNSVLAPTDSIVDAYGKLQAQLNAQFTSITGLDTDDVAEASNLYFTDTRAQTAAVVNSTAGSETTQAPSVSAVKNYVDARATQWSNSGSHIYYNSGSVGIGTASPIDKFEVNGSMTLKGGYLTLQRPVTAGSWARGMHFTPDGSVDATNDGLAGIGLLGNATTQQRFYMTFGSSPWSSTTGLIVESTGRVGIGTNAPLGQIHTFGTEPVFFDRVSGNPSHLLLRGAKGSIGAETAPLENHEVGRISFTGFDGSDWATTALAGISGRASEDWSPTTRGTDLDFKTVTNGSLSEQTRMIIANDGKVGIGSDDPISKLTVRGADSSTNGPMLTLAGDVSNQFEAGRIRFAEPNNTFQGGYIHYDGTGPDYLHIGVHETADLLTSSDVNAISISRQTANVGVGTSTPSSRLHVYENGKHYHVNRKIDGYSQTENSTGINYILLHRAYDGALLDEHYINGEINIRRGGTAAWNRKVSAQVNTACAYDSCRGNIINYGEYTYLAYVTYSGVKYLALAIPDNSSMYNATFTGYAYNATGVEQLRLVYDTDVTSVTSFSQNAIHTNAINVAAGNISTASGYALGYNLSSTTDRYALYPYLLGQKSKTGLGPSLPYDNAMSIESDALITFVETDADKVSGFMDLNSNTFVWDGNIGIGMTNPSNALHVTGNIGATGWVGAGCEGSCSTDAYAINYADGRIRTFSGTGSACEKAGGSATFTCSSDRRLKHDIEDFKDGIDVIMKLRPRTYVWNADESEKIHYGFIAQEVQEAIPHAVTVDTQREDGEYLTLNQGEFTPYIINALQDLNHMIEDNKKMFNFMSSGIESKVDENSREIASLKEENAEIKAENKMLKDYLCSKDPEAPFCGQ
ncbi:tail fiber domain-containing protein [Halobacteriovorax sp. ZH5_bin.2]|uniref:tail fiber domain-containing protein n=1 Tax=unclassified Halobacteriovorax TaxID=2639665 RepID=UPI003720A919